MGPGYHFKPSEFFWMSHQILSSTFQYNKRSISRFFSLKWFLLAHSVYYKQILACQDFCPLNLAHLLKKLATPADFGFTIWQLDINYKNFFQSVQLIFPIHVIFLVLTPVELVGGLSKFIPRCFRHQPSQLNVANVHFVVFDQTFIQNLSCDDEKWAQVLHPDWDWLPALQVNILVTLQFRIISKCSDRTLR